MDDGFDLIRRLGLEELQPGADQLNSAAIWVLALTVRELASDLIFTQGVLASVVKDNDLDLAEKTAWELVNVGDKARTIYDRLEHVAERFQPVEIPDRP